jgi:hypothetical protein
MTVQWPCLRRKAASISIALLSRTSQFTRALWREQRKCDGGDRTVTFVEHGVVINGFESSSSSSLSSTVYVSLLVAVAGSMSTACMPLDLLTV